MVSTCLQVDDERVIPGHLISLDGIMNHDGEVEAYREQYIAQWMR